VAFLGIRELWHELDNHNIILTLLQLEGYTGNVKETDCPPPSDHRVKYKRNVNMSDPKMCQSCQIHLPL